MPSDFSNDLTADLNRVESDIRNGRDEPTPKINQRVSSVSRLEDAHVPSHLIEQYQQRRAMQDHQQASSWGEMLENYRQEKTVFKHRLPVVERITRERSYLWREKQRELDPVVQRFIDPVRERQQRAIETESANNPSSRVQANINPLWAQHEERNDEQICPRLKAKIVRRMALGAPHPSDQCTTDFDTLLGKNKLLNTKYRERIDFNPITNEYKTENSRRKKVRILIQHVMCSEGRKEGHSFHIH